MKLACLIQAWLPDLSQARFSLHINLNLSEEGKYVSIPSYVFTVTPLSLLSNL